MKRTEQLIEKKRARVRMVNLALGSVKAKLSSWSRVRDNPQHAPGRALSVLAAWSHMARFKPGDAPSDWSSELDSAVRADVRQLVEQFSTLSIIDNWITAASDLEVRQREASGDDEFDELGAAARDLFETLDNFSLAVYAVRRLLPTDAPLQQKMDELAPVLEKAEQYLADHPDVFLPAADLVSAFWDAYRDDLEEADPELFLMTQKHRELREYYKTASAGRTGGPETECPEEYLQAGRATIPFSRRVAFVAMAAAATILVALGLAIWTDGGGAGRQLVANLEDNGQLIGLDVEGELVGPDSWSSDARRSVQEMLLHQRLPSSTILSTIPVTRSADDVPVRSTFKALIQPINTAVRSDRPTFRWKAPQDMPDGYFVSILDADARMVAQSDSVKQTEWTATEALARGQVYFWRVTFVRDGHSQQAPRPDQPLPAFRVLEAETLARVQAAESNVPGSHLALAVVYGEAGLLDDAERELEALQAANSGSELLAILLASIERLRYKSQ